MKHDAFRLAPRAARLVLDTIIEHCRLRGWTLHAANVRSNHVHVVVSCPCHPKDASRQFKAWSTRRLREASLAGRQVWTEGGSARWLFDDDAVRRAVQYVNDEQGSPPPGR